MDDHQPKKIMVEVAYATPQKQLIIPLTVNVGTTAFEAAVQSKIVEEFPEIDLATIPMGIFSKPLDGKTRALPKDYELQIRDRVELYRPLIIDPMAARLARAAKAKEKADAKLQKQGQEKAQEKEREKTKAKIE